MSIFVAMHGCCKEESKRFVASSADILESRFHQMDLTIQNLKEQISGYDNLVNKMQIRINGLEQEVSIRGIIYAIRNFHSSSFLVLYLTA